MRHPLRAPRFQAAARRLRRLAGSPPLGPSLIGAGLIGSLALLAGPIGSAGTEARPAEPAPIERRLARHDARAPERQPVVRDDGPAPTAAPSPEPLAVVRFRPLHGTTGVPRSTTVSVRFSQPMDRASTEAAFRASIDGARVGGSVSWAERDSLLVLAPDRALPYGARIQLSVGSGATSRVGDALPEARSVTFEVEPRPVPIVPAASPGSTPVATPTPTPRPAPRATPRPAPAANGWRWPLDGPITQRFGESLTKYGFHQGIDINGETGDPVRAAHSGVVRVAGRYDDCSGLQVTVDHGDGRQTWYRHLSRIDVRLGRRVDAGTRIGAVGNTGCSLGSHLHFAVRQGGRFVDPLRYLPPR